MSTKASHRIKLSKMNRTAEGMYSAKMPSLAAKEAKTAAVEIVAFSIAALAAILGVYYLFSIDEQALIGIRSAMF